MANGRKPIDLDPEKALHITSCTILWQNTDDILCVKTRIFGGEVEVTFYNGNDNVESLIGGRIWPMPKQMRQELFDILEKCVYEWDCDDYTADQSDPTHWMLKVCTKGSCIRSIKGSIEPPPYGHEIKKIIEKIVGNENCYFFDR